jgi:hypothetical protein
LVKLLENKHPLKVENNDKDVGTSVESHYVLRKIIGVAILECNLIRSKTLVIQWIFLNIERVVYFSLVFS